jgi:hypothetical protein
MKHPITAVSFVLLISSMSACAQANGGSSRPLWTSLSCHAQTTKNINLGGDANSPNSDSIKIIYRKGLLEVTVNGNEYKKALGDASLATDTYRIDGFGVRSISATHVVAPDSIVHTLVIDNDGKQAMWTETGYSWEPPFRPFGSMVLLTCQ